MEPPNKKDKSVSTIIAPQVSTIMPRLPNPKLGQCAQMGLAHVPGPIECPNGSQVQIEPNWAKTRAQLGQWANDDGDGGASTTNRGGRMPREAQPPHNPADVWA